jgi:hydroxymethylpyrimidine/phosphomethylpyrimidine kinase
MAVLIRELFPLATLVTPNLDEAGWLIGRSIRSVEGLEPAARDMLALGARAVLLKGGHLEGPELTDLLLAPPAPARRWSDARIDTRNTHGTGCTLSSAIACGLAQGLALVDAVDAARRYVRGALRAGADVTTGQGHGPLNHGFAPQPTRVLAAQPGSVEQG